MNFSREGYWGCPLCRSARSLHFTQASIPRRKVAIIPIMRRKTTSSLIGVEHNTDGNEQQAQGDPGEVNGPGQSVRNE